MLLKVVQCDRNVTLKVPLSQWIYAPGDGRPSLIAPKDAARKKKAAIGAASTERSHYLLSGGIWNVPLELNDEFLWHYAVSMFQGHSHGIVERRTDLFRFHIDMDFAEAAEVPLDRAVQCVGVVQGVLRKFFPFAPNEAFECTVSATTSKAVENAEGPAMVKTGYHVIWAHFWVTQQQALDIRASIIAFLKSKFGWRTPPQQNLWENVVDESIYCANGLRMIGATKYSSCKCRRLKKDTPAPPCDTCGGHGTVNEGRPYWIVALLDARCDPVTRTVPRPKAGAGPVLRVETNHYLPCAGRTSCAVPDWSPPSSDDVVIKDPFPLSELLHFGDLSKMDVDGKEPEQVWALVHKLHNTLRFTSLRMPPELAARVAAKEVDAIPVFKKYQLAPPAASAEDIEKRNALEAKNGVHRPRNSRRKVELLNEFKQVQTDKLKYVSDDKLIADIELFIRRHVGVRMYGEPKYPYADVSVVDIAHFDNGKPPDRFFVHVEGLGSAYCRNRQGDHNRHSIYFEIGPEGRKKTDAKYVFQRCFCRCPTTQNRIGGECKKYRNKEATLPSVLRTRLFQTESSPEAPPVPSERAERLNNPEPFDARKVLSIFNDNIDLKEYERFKARKREADELMRQEAQEKRMRTEQDAVL